jgi:hypothetical protein
MNIGQQVCVLGGMILTGIGSIMAIGNPEPAAYAEYATEELTTYLKDNVCTQAPRTLGSVLKRHCYTLVDTGRPQLQSLITQKTERKNFIFFSIYRTNLSISSTLPSYHFETLGVMQQFYLYQADES